MSYKVFPLHVIQYYLKSCLVPNYNNVTKIIMTVNDSEKIKIALPLRIY
jgi:hypothetical protein